MARKYELGKRAQTQQETRRRIVEATVELHRTIGPARTTISKIAELAGIERKTFYRHFPDPDQVLAECSTLYRTLNPPPDPNAWLAIDDPHERVRHGLRACYRYYRANEAMIGNVLRDRDAGLHVGDGFLNHRAAAANSLAKSFTRHPRRRAIRAALAVAVDFHTWQTLTRNGLTDQAAADLTSGLVRMTATVQE
jgi:AcrR family transcriptional regulator